MSLLHVSPSTEHNKRMQLNKLSPELNTKEQKWQNFKRFFFIGQLTSKKNYLFIYLFVGFFKLKKNMDYLTVCWNTTLFLNRSVILALYYDQSSYWNMGLVPWSAGSHLFTSFCLFTNIFATFSLSFLSCYYLWSCSLISIDNVTTLSCAFFTFYYLLVIVVISRLA